MTAARGCLGCSPWYWQRGSAHFSCGASGTPARLAYAGGERVEELVGTPRPAPAPATPRMAQPVPARAPAPPPTQPRGDGIVSARLRPWLEIEFGATRAVVTDDATTIHFDVTLFNSGGAPARDVRVEAQMFNAGPAQDSELGAFFGRPAPSGRSHPGDCPAGPDRHEKRGGAASRASEGI